MMCASDMAALLGVSTYGDAYTVWLDKTGRSIDYTNDQQAYGLDYEDAAIQHWLNRYADFPIKIRRAGLIQSKRYKRAGATLDRLSVCPAGRCIIEAKTQIDDREWGDDLTAPEIPVPFQFQGQWQLFATGRDHVHFVVDGSRHRSIHRVMQRDEELMINMALIAAKFWGRHVIMDVPPTATRRAAEGIKQQYGQPERGREHMLTGSQADLMHRIRNRKRVLDLLKARLADDEANLQAQVGESTELLWPDRTLAATWRASRVIDGTNKGWVKANAELAERYRVERYVTEIDVEKMVADNAGLLPTGLRYRRSWNLKGMDS
jgi:predicted phage-related endonuclease